MRAELWQTTHLMHLSLPETSPPQRMLFNLYYKIHGERAHALPALLPEVWLHWDPYTAKARGAKTMRNLRMDFLMLLPGGHRIVLEVDGRNHDAESGRAEPTIYAKTMRGDRELKLARYDVFRFGAADLTDEPAARKLLQAFFSDLFKTYHVTGDPKHELAALPERLSWQFLRLSMFDSHVSWGPFCQMLYGHLGCDMQDVLRRGG
ncbi:hypothetical protein Lfu02_78610 [Longispora fulva]|uniref:DUF559 domain-containing protein n=1 Tax=Longispora fulva TaxID=619741 RepID=A0A8J7KFN3_9ACTN|nr:hypothetical protein [Longispora fulva]MBG6133954.1 hypothetical protein [Longispora fulva]GIG63489.1 hypothetical protein Lfu02_78610 [Longispora fulva]